MDYKINGSLLPYVECNLNKGESISAEAGAMLYMNPKIEYKVKSHFQKKLGAGFFGGEGFIMNKLTGKGTAFIEIDGTSIEYNLKADEEIIIATGHLAMMESTCTMDIKGVKGIGNVLFGGEGMFNTVVRGPGKVIMQTMTIGELSAKIAPYMAYKGR